TPPPMESASFIAGMTIEMLEGSAKQLLDYAVPCNSLRDLPPRTAQPLGPLMVVRKFADRRRERRGIGLADKSVFTVAHELEWAARIGRGDHRLGGRKHPTHNALRCVV